MTTEGQWEHHHSSVIISLWTINVTCFLRQKDLIEGEHKKQVYTERCNRSPSKTVWFWPLPKLCPWQKSSSEVAATCAFSWLRLETKQQQPPKEVALSSVDCGLDAL